VAAVDIAIQAANDPPSEQVDFPPGRAKRPARRGAGPPPPGRQRRAGACGPSRRCSFSSCSAFDRDRQSNFIEPRNLIRIANAAAVPLTLAMGTTFIILMGSIDLSAEGAVAISATTVVLLAANDSNANNFSWLAVLAAVIASGLMGFLSGNIQTRLRIPSFMATLGTWFSGSGSPLICSAAPRCG